MNTQNSQDVDPTAIVDLGGRKIALSRCRFDKLKEKKVGTSDASSWASFRAPRWVLQIFYMGNADGKWVGQQLDKGHGPCGSWQCTESEAWKKKLIKCRKCITCRFVGRTDRWWWRADTLVFAIQIPCQRSMVLFCFRTQLWSFSRGWREASLTAVAEVALGSQFQKVL